MKLDEIAERTRHRIAGEKKQMPAEELRRWAESLGADTGFPFKQVLSQAGLSFICEVKKASPSKGEIAPHFPYLDIAREYEAAGAAALSVLTEPYYFKGSDRYLEEIAAAVKLPILRKDFTVDPYMIHQARVIGAAAVLLICAILDDQELVEYREIAEGLGLSVLVEAHDEAEVRRAVGSGAGIIGVNNRDLKTFQVDVTTSLRLRSLVPKDIIFVSESGITTPQDTARLYANGTDAVLIGETLMRSSNKKKMLNHLQAGGAADD